MAVEADRLILLRGAEAENPSARRTIDATGLVVAPGFIDLHSHSALMILAEPRHEPKVRQGVTTEIVGVDGNCLRAVPSPRGPARRSLATERRPRWRARPRAATGVTIDDYLARLRRRVSVNIGYLVGNCVLRINASAGTTCRRSEPPWTDMRGAARARRCRPARSVFELGPRLPARRIRDDRLSWPSSPARPRARRHLPHPRALPARRSLSRSVPRGDRDRPPRRWLGPHHPLLPPARRYPGTPEQMIELVD